MPEDTYASQMAAGLEPGNFTCTAEELCAFRPIFQRVNVLAEVLEFVVAGEPSYSPPGEEERTTLYRFLPLVMGYLSPDSGAQWLSFCGHAIEPQDGELAIHEHGERSEELETW